MEAVTSMSSSRVSGALLKRPRVPLFIYYLTLEVTNTLEKTRDYYLAALSVCLRLVGEEERGALIKARR